jgi:hypothetical protein
MSIAEPSEFVWNGDSTPGRTQSRSRREGERAVSYWERKYNELGGHVTVAALDLGRINEREWSNRFLIAIDPMIERSALVLYGPKFAQLLHLPEQARPDLPFLRQLPRRYGDVFLKGCREAHGKTEPVHVEGEAERYDGRIEQYRAVFIPVGVKRNSLTCFAFGAFNNRIVSAPAAA